MPGAGGQDGRVGGTERCLRESDGPFDVMYVHRRNGAQKVKSLSDGAVYKREHTRADGIYTRHADTLTRKLTPCPPRVYGLSGRAYYPGHLTFARDPAPGVAVGGVFFFFFCSLTVLAFHIL